MMSDRDILIRALTAHPPEVAGDWYGCASCHVSTGNAASYAAHVVDALTATHLVIAIPRVTPTETGKP